jgi:hypothetical protein
MTELTADYLDFLLERHADDEIYHTALSMKEQMAELDREVDPEKKEALTETLLADFTLLKHLMGEGSRGGEDYINDGVFHAKG